MPPDGAYGTARDYDPVRDEPGLVRSAEIDKQLGFRAKICIHPSQVVQVNRIFFD